MNTSTKKLFFTAAVAGILGGLNAESAFAKKPAKTAEVKGNCTEANTCKGSGSCAGTAEGAKHTCKGQNTCAGNVVEGVTEAKCKELKGSFKPNA